MSHTDVQKILDDGVPELNKTIDSIIAVTNDRFTENFIDKENEENPTMEKLNEFRITIAVFIREINERLIAQLRSSINDEDAKEQDTLASILLEDEKQSDNRQWFTFLEEHGISRETIISMDMKARRQAIPPAEYSKLMKKLRDERLDIINRFNERKRMIHELYSDTFDIKQKELQWWFNRRFNEIMLSKTKTMTLSRRIILTWALRKIDWRRNPLYTLTEIANDMFHQVMDAEYTGGRMTNPETENKLNNNMIFYRYMGLNYYTTESAITDKYLELIVSQTLEDRHIQTLNDKFQPFMRTRWFLPLPSNIELTIPGPDRGSMQRETGGVVEDIGEGNGQADSESGFSGPQGDSMGRMPKGNTFASMMERLTNTLDLYLETPNDQRDSCI
jgi:hypothetical protein